MRILVLGSGAREHAIVTSLLTERDEQGGQRHEVTVAPGNAGIAEQVTTVNLDATNGDVVSEFAIENDIDLVIVGPEAPLIAGVADEPRERGIPVFGPGRAAAQLEGSKTFAKRVMDAASVPTGRAVRAATLAEAEAAMDDLGAPHVIKADGLAAGKGVIVTSDRAAATAHAEHWLQHGSVLVEEFLDGEEVSLFFLSDGHTVLPLSPAQDYKRLLDGDDGPNTGGMGAYSPLPWLAEQFGSEAEFIRQVQESVAVPVVRQLAAEQTPFIGLLYCGLIVTAQGVKVIEFNARFGDPETQVVLPRLAEPLSELLLSAASGRLSEHEAPAFLDQSAVTVVLASEGYPEEPITGRPLTGLAEALQVEGVHITHAATASGAEPGVLYSAGGRVLSVVGLGADFAEARERAYRALGEIGLEGGQFRSDIAAKVV